MKPNKIDYILNYYENLMTKEESLAWRHYSSLIKLGNNENGKSDETRKKFYLKRGWLTENPQILGLLNDGIEEFRRITAERILKDNPGKIKFNNCPECGELARTPKAKQCRYCGHDWH